MAPPTRPGTATHHLTLYRAPSGALVFGAGTVQWSWGLDGEHDRGTTTPDPRMQQATVNLLADMGAQPGQPAGRPRARHPDDRHHVADDDDHEPARVVKTSRAGRRSRSPVPPRTNPVRPPGGQVGGVEVSVDGGGTWHPAVGRESWSYSWTPTSIGSTTIRARAVDDSGNLENPGAQVGVNVFQRPCPCSIWNNSVSAPQDPDPNAIELGVKFRSDTSGFITGVRFYKTAGDTGTHVGRLWSAGGTQLAQRHLRRGERQRLAGSQLRQPGADRSRYDLRRLVSRPERPLRVDLQLFRLQPESTILPSTRSRMDRTGPMGSSTTARPGRSSRTEAPTSFGSANYLVDVVFETTPGPRHDSADDRLPRPRRRCHGRRQHHQSDRDLQRGDERRHDKRHHRGTSRARWRIRFGAGGLQRFRSARSRSIQSAPLQASTTYTATIKGGASGVTDLAGNPLAADSSWTLHHRGGLRRPRRTKDRAGRSW